MPMPAITTGIIHIEIDCAPAKSNADLSIEIDIPPTGTSLAILKALSESSPETKTLPDESVAIPLGSLSELLPSPVLSMISTGVKNSAYAIGEVSPIENTVVIIKIINDTLPILTPTILPSHQIT